MVKVCLADSAAHRGSLRQKGSMQGNKALRLRVFQLSASQSGPQRTSPFLLALQDGGVTISLLGFASAAPSPSVVKSSP